MPRMAEMKYRRCLFIIPLLFPSLAVALNIYEQGNALLSDAATRDAAAGGNSSGWSLRYLTTTVLILPAVASAGDAYLKQLSISR